MHSLGASTDRQPRADGEGSKSEESYFRFDELPGYQELHIQRAAAERKAFAGNVAFVKTSSFARPAKDSPNVGHGHHWFGNAESYFLIGDALGHAMVKLRTRPKN